MKASAYEYYVRDEKENKFNKVTHEEWLKSHDFRVVNDMYYRINLALDERTYNAEYRGKDTVDLPMDLVYSIISFFRFDPRHPRLLKGATYVLNHRASCVGYFRGSSVQMGVKACRAIIRDMGELMDFLRGVDEDDDEDKEELYYNYYTDYNEGT